MFTGARRRRRGKLHELHQDHVNGAFTRDAPDRVWVADVTQHRTDEGWLYLSVVLDVFQRKAVGWAMDGVLNTELVLSAFSMAQQVRRPDPGLVHHSDQGSPYGSLRFGRIFALQGSWAAWAVRARRRTTRSPRASSPPCRPNCSIATTGPRGTGCERRSSSLSRSSTTARVHSYGLLPERGPFTQNRMLPEVRGGVEGAEPEYAYET